MRKVIKSSIQDFDLCSIDPKQLIHLKGGDDSSDDIVGTIDVLDG